ncbi:MAG: hypothetical protein ABH884_03955 [Candidatus Komeilibacteria bacterium]
MKIVLLLVLITFVWPQSINIVPIKLDFPCPKEPKKERKCDWANQFAILPKEITLLKNK